jgi:hypothetical protein
MIPLLTLMAFYAPTGHRATWFALMASLMNLALVAGQLQTKYLNEVFVVQRGEYSELGPLLIIAALLGFILPIGAILSCSANARDQNRRRGRNGWTSPTPSPRSVREKIRKRRPRKHALD